MKIYNVDRNIRNEVNFPFWFSMLKEASEIIDFNQIKLVMDFGCGNGGFSRLVHQTFSGLLVTGIEVDKNLISSCKRTNQNNSINYFDYNLLSSLPKADVVFSQEVVYTQESLFHHAEEVFNALHDGGHYFFTMGCHIENPTWAIRRSSIRDGEIYPAFDYSLEDVADAFFKAGFRVTVKKLPMYVPMKYVPRKGEFASLSDMVCSSEDHKFLFVMLKPCYKKVTSAL